MAVTGGARVAVIERVCSGLPPQIGLCLPQLPPVISNFEGVIAGGLGQRRCDLNVVERLRASAVEAALLGAERRDRPRRSGRRRFDAEARQLLVIAEKSRRRRREPEARRIDRIEREQIVVEAQPASLQVEHGGRREHRGVADRIVEIEAIGRAARNLDTVELAGEVVTFFPPEVPDEAPVGALITGPLVVDPHHLEVVRIRPGLIDKKILGEVRHRGLIRRRKVPEQVARDGIDSVGRDDVARERIPYDDAVHQSRSAGIEDLHAVRQQLGEVARPHPRGRHRARERLDRVVLQLFVREHEERLVSEDRAADRAAEPVVVARCLAGAVPLGREEIFRPRVVAVVVRGGAVELVRPRLQRQVHRTRAGVAHLRVVGGGFDFELLDRVRGRLDAGARLRHDVARSVDRELAVDRPGDRHAAKVVVVHRPLQRVRPLERCAGDEPRQAIGRSIPKRNFADELGVDHLPDGRAAGLELRALADDEDRL